MFFFFFFLTANTQHSHTADQSLGSKPLQPSPEWESGQIPALGAKLKEETAAALGGPGVCELVHPPALAASGMCRRPRLPARMPRDPRPQSVTLPGFEKAWKRWINPGLGRNSRFCAARCPLRSNGSSCPRS